MTDTTDMSGDGARLHHPGAQRLFLVTENADSGDAPLRALELDRAPRYLRFGAAGVPELLAQPVRGEADIMLEVVDAGARSLVLVQQSPECGGAPRVNGTPMPPLGFVRSGDQMLVRGRLLHVASFTRPPVAPATAEMVGRECPLCRGPVGARDEVYVCPCGWGPVHWSSEPGEDGGDALECATLLRECAACKRPMILEERWDDVPVVE